MKVGVHFIRRRLLRRAEANGGWTKHNSVLRCAAGFEAVGAASTGRDPEFVSWDEVEPADDFVGRVDALVGIPDIRLLNARKRTGRRIPYLLLVMGDATRAVPFVQPIMDRLQSNDTLVCSCADDQRILRLFLDPPSEHSLARAPMPSDLSAFVPRTSLTQIAADELRGFDPSRPLILSAERLKAGKGVHRVIPLVADLRDRGHRPILILLGASASSQRSAYQAEIESELAKLDLADSTVLLPFLKAEDLAPLYARSTFVVSTATIYDQNFGYVPIESMMAGTPPIASDFGGYRDSVLDGVTGVRMPTTLEADGSISLDWQPAATAASELLADPEEYAAMAAAGRRHMDENFSVAAALRMYSEIATVAVNRDPSSLPPWRVSALGQAAIDAGWTDQTDNADRTARIPRGNRARTIDYDRIHRIIYAKYASQSKAVVDHEP